MGYWEFDRQQPTDLTRDGFTPSWLSKSLMLLSKKTSCHFWMSGLLGGTSLQHPNMVWEETGTRFPSRRPDSLPRKQGAVNAGWAAVWDQLLPSWWCQVWIPIPSEWDCPSSVVGCVSESVCNRLRGIGDCTGGRDARRLPQVA